MATRLLDYPFMSNGHILITGTSTGIGRACALQLARRGYLVWAGVRSEEDGKSIEAAGSGMPGAIRAVQLDVTDIVSIRAAEEKIRSNAQDEGLFGLVNNAGICVVGPVEFLPLEDYRRQFEVNLFGAIAVTQVMLPLLRVHNTRLPERRSRIVNICSITGEVSTPIFSAYSASKFALRAVNDALRLELAADGIHVCLVVPGTIESKIWEKEKEGVQAIVARPGVRKVYGALIDNVAGYVFECAKKALPAERAAEVVEKCFVSVRPRIQYRVGWEATVGSRAKKIIPDRIFDFLMGRTLGVPTVRGRGNGAVEP